MARTKISEFSSTPANNTDIDSINIAEGCAPSGINDAIRELMSQLKDFQVGAVGDSFNGPVGSTTASTGAFTTLTTTGTINLLTVGRGAGAVSSNTAVGASALAANTSGATNTAVGYQALTTISTGSDATAVGWQALQNATGSTNTAVGSIALWKTTTGVENTAVGKASLTFNTTGSYNVAIGKDALISNTTASNNTAVGYQAGYSTTTGGTSTYIGYQAGYTNTTNDYNTYVGWQAGYTATGRNNTFVGLESGKLMTTGIKNTILGAYNGNTGGLDIRTSSNYIVLSDGDGNPCIVTKYAGGTWLYGNIGTGAGTNAIKYNTTSKELTYDTSSARYKDNIRDSVYGLDAVMALRSTMFEYKKEQRTDVGLIAEEVDLVIPELVGKNSEGQPDSVSYDRMVSVLVKAIQELKTEFDAYKASHP
jgi:hypothetical protein